VEAAGVEPHRIHSINRRYRTTFPPKGPISHRFTFSIHYPPLPATPRESTWFPETIWRRTSSNDQSFDGGGPASRRRKRGPIFGKARNSCRPVRPRFFGPVGDNQEKFSTERGLRTSNTAAGTHPAAVHLAEPTGIGRPEEPCSRVTEKHVSRIHLTCVIYMLRSGND
jgi:hypothetical protein